MKQEAEFSMVWPNKEKEVPVDESTMFPDTMDGITNKILACMPMTYKKMVTQEVEFGVNQDIATEVIKLRMLGYYINDVATMLNIPEEDAQIYDGMVFWAKEKVRTIAAPTLPQAKQ